jgi:hypothetical protein
MLTNPGTTPTHNHKGAPAVTDTAANLRQLLDRAQATLMHGDALEVERGAKAISALIRAERELAEFARALPPEDDEEARRAELRRRLALFVEADLAGAPAEVLERIAVHGSAQ